MNSEAALGYKLTEAGLIPLAWDALPLKDALSRGRLGGNYGNSERETSAPLMKMGNINRGTFSLDKIEYIQDVETVDPSHKLNKGDVLFNTRNTLELVGKVAIWRDELPIAYYNSNLMRLEFDQSKIASTEYANYALNSRSSIARLKAIATGTTSVAAIYTRDLLFFCIAVPPKAEQIAIGNALSDIDSLISELDQLIVKKRDIQQATMQQLLTGQRRLPGFSGEWEVKRLGDIASLNRINVVPFATPDKTFMHFSLPAFDEGKRPVREPGAAIGSNKFSVPANAILVSKLNPRIPRVWLPQEIPTNAVASTEFLVLTPGDGVAREFLYVVCKSSSFCAQMELAATGTTGSHQRISPGSALSLSVDVPSEKSEQSAIATILFDMDTEIASLESRLEKTRQLKQGMMQELLTGRVRLV